MIGAAQTRKDGGRSLNTGNDFRRKSGRNEINPALTGRALSCHVARLQ